MGVRFPAVVACPMTANPCVGVVNPKSRIGAPPKVESEIALFQVVRGSILKYKKVAANDAATAIVFSWLPAPAPPPHPKMSCGVPEPKKGVASATTGLADSPFEHLMG